MDIDTKARDVYLSLGLREDQFHVWFRRRIKHLNLVEDVNYRYEAPNESTNYAEHFVTKDTAEAIKPYIPVTEKNGHWRW